MHDSISNKVVENLNRLASRYQMIEFKEAFNSLSDDHKQSYCSKITARGHVSSMFGILNAVGKEDVLQIFDELLQENKKFAFKTLDVISPKFTLFKTLFGELNQHKEEYIKYVTEEQKSFCTMSYILNAMAKDQAVSMFYDLLKKDQGFAFNTLDTAFYRSDTLFNTLFSQLNPQQKEDYRVCLEKQPTFRAQLTLRNFYSNNKEGSSELRTENSNKDSLGNESLAQKRADSDEFSEFNPGIFFPNSVTLDGIIDQYELDFRDLVPEFVEEIYTEPAAKRQRIL